MKKILITKTKIDKVIVWAMVKLCDALGIKVTAEGIETDEDREMLNNIGCNSGQSFLFAHRSADEHGSECSCALECQLRLGQTVR